MFIPFGEIGLGKLSEKDKQSFLDYLSGQLEDKGAIKPVMNSEMVRKGVGWDTVSKAADIAQIVGFTYIVGKGTPKTLRNFFEYAKQWAHKNNKDYNTKEIEAFVEFMEKDKK